MKCSSCDAQLQCLFDERQSWCIGCGRLIWMNPDGTVHAIYTPSCLDSYELDSQIFRMIRDVLEAVGCLHGRRCGESTPPMMYSDWIRCAIAKREQRITQLQSQLPAGMSNCTIVFKECEVGHGWLTATNWKEHDCPLCRIEALQSVIDTHNLCHNLHGQVDAASFAEGCAQEQRKLYGCAPDADLAEKLLADNRRLKDRIAALEQELDESYDF